MNTDRLLMTRDDSVEEECPRYRRVLGNEITSASLSLNESAVLKKKKTKTSGLLLFQSTTISCDLENLFFYNIYFFIFNFFAMLLIPFFLHYFYYYY